MCSLSATRNCQSADMGEESRESISASQDELASVVDRLFAGVVCFHGLDLSGRVRLPAEKFAHDAQRLARAIRLRRIAGKLLVRQIGVVDEGAGRFHYVDSAAAFTFGQIRSPR